MFFYYDFNLQWGLGIGDGDWGLGIGPNPQSPIPNPQSPIPIKFIISFHLIIKKIINQNNINYFNNMSF